MKKKSAGRNRGQRSLRPRGSSGNAARPFTRQEEDRFTALVCENLPWARNYARTFKISDAESAVFTALAKALRLFDPAKGSFASVLRCLLYWELISMIRSDVRWRSLFVPLGEDFEFGDEAASAQMDRYLQRDWLAAALAQLSDAEQELIRLKYEQGLTLEEIIARL